MKTQFEQKAKVGEAGSFVNQLMANNSTIPVVGKGATELLYSDRRCYEVIEVSEDLKTVKLELLDARAALGEQQIGHQNWIFEPTGQFITIVWRNNAWRKKTDYVKFTKEFKARVGEGSSYFRSLTKEQRQAVYGDSVFPQNVVEGITRSAVKYDRIRIIFGVRNYHYDWEF